MRMVIDLQGILHEVDSSIIEKWTIKEEQLIGETYFLQTKSGDFFSVHENFWVPFKRDKKINQILK